VRENNILKLQKLSFREYFNKNKLAFILEHLEEVEALYRDDAHNQVALDKYYFNSRSLKNNRGSIGVKYVQVDNKLYGRYQAVGSLGAQGMVREARCTIFDEHYVDIDCDNAHPAITKWLCYNMKIECPCLNEYVDNREARIIEIRDLNDGLSRDTVKKAFLAISYGCGNAKVNDLITHKSKFLLDFRKEITNIQTLISEKLHKFLTINTEIRNSRDKKYNYLGSTMSHICQFVENQLLMMIYNYIATKLKKEINHCILCFDGIMIPKKSYNSEFLREIENVFKDAGINIGMSCKPMVSLDLATMGYDENTEYIYSITDRIHAATATAESETIQDVIGSNSLASTVAADGGVVIPNGGELVVYRRLNRLFNFPDNIEWNVSRASNNNVCVAPQCDRCLYAVDNHNDSHLLIKTDNSIMKICRNCSEANSLDRGISNKILVELKIITETQENNMYQSLVKEILQSNEFGDWKYVRERDTGVIYIKIKSYAYVKHMEPKIFLNDIFRGNDDFISHPNNIDNLVKFLKEYDHEDFPFINYNKEYIGFSNGVLNLVNCQFTENPEGIIVKTYFDKEFTYSTETPLLDQILHYQFDDEVTKFIYACLGRLFSQQDNFGFMLYLMGETQCGKSVILNTVKHCFNNFGSIDASYEVKYGLSYLYDKDIVICDDLPQDINKILPQQTFQSIITGGSIATAVKRGDALQIEKWNVPLLFAGNFYPKYLDKGQISRRILTVNFEKTINEVDTTLEDRIFNHELSAFIYKSILLYQELLLSNKHRSIWDICPDYFTNQQLELRKERNPLFKFLMDCAEYKDGNMILLEDVRESFSNFICTKVSRLDNGTFAQVNKKYIIVKLKTCKHCFSTEGSGCCSLYHDKDRTDRKWIRNMMLINGA